VLSWRLCGPIYRAQYFQELKKPFPVKQLGIDKPCLKEYNFLGARTPGNQVKVMKEEKTIYNLILIALLSVGIFLLIP
jgi:hypothetical protein